MSLDNFQPVQGNRNALTFDQREILESEVLPTARKWVREYPSLRSHGRQTLAYWGEEAPSELRP